MFVYVVTGCDGGWIRMWLVCDCCRDFLHVCVCGFGVLFIHIETSGSSYLPLSHDDDVMLVGMEGA